MDAARRNQDIQALQSILIRLNQNLASLSEQEVDAFAKLLPDFVSIYQKTIPEPDLSKRFSRDYLHLLHEVESQNSLLEAIFAADPAALAVLVGLDLRFTFVNPAYRYLIPDPIQNPLDRTYEDVWQEKSSYCPPDSLRNVLMTGQPAQVSGVEIYFMDGTRRTFNLQARRIEWSSEAAVLVILWDITGLNEAQNQLRSTALFPEQNPYPVLRLSLDGCILYANPASLQLLPEYQPGELAPEFWQVAVKDAYQNREKCTIDFEHQGRVYSFVVVPILEAGYINLYGQDITERKQILEELQKSEEEYRTLVQYAPVGIYEVDFRQNRFTSVNDAMCQVSGYSREELLKMSPFPLLDDDSRARFRERLGRWLAGEKSDPNVEYRVILKDGRKVDALLNVTFTADELGNPLGATVVIIDITERKQAERALQDSESRLANFIKFAPAGIYELDLRHQRITSVNEMMCQLSGYTREELLTINPADLLDEESRQRFQQRLKGWLSGEKQDESITYQVRTKDGRLLDVLLGGSIHVDEHGLPLSATVIGFDITPARQAETVKRKHAIQIELQKRLLEQREQERLQIARDLHDGPVQELTGAHYTLEKLVSSIRDDTLKQEVIAIRDTIRNQVAELRDYAGELRPPTLSQFGLEKAIRSYAETFQAKHPDIQITIEVMDEGRILPEDKRLAFFRIYQEALTNITKYCPKAEVKIVFEMNAHAARLEITDNGPGFEVPEDWLMLARTGHLGLVGMRERVEAVGGTLSITSTPREGTTLRADAPL